MMFNVMVVFFMGSRFLLIWKLIGNLLEVVIILLFGFVFNYGRVDNLGIENLMVVFVFLLVLKSIVFSVFILF